MAKNDDQIAQFKKIFPAKFDAFMKKRGLDEAQASQWKLASIQRSRNQLNFIKISGTKEYMTATIPFPQNLSSEEHQELAKYLNETCGKKGFKPLHLNPLPTIDADMRERLKNADSDAWNKYAGEHFSHLTMQAERQLRQPHKAIARKRVDAEDVVNESLETLFMFASRGEYNYDYAPNNLITNKAQHLILDAARAERIARKYYASLAIETDRRDDATAPHNKLMATFQEEFPIVVEETKKHLTNDQKRLLDMLIANDGDIEQKAMAENIGISRTTTFRHFGILRDEMRKAAQRLGCDATIAILETLSKEEPHPPVTPPSR